MRVRGNRRGSVLAICLLFTVASVTMLTTFRADTAHAVDAGQISPRSLDLLTGSTGDGGSKPGGKVDHKFTFTLPTAGSVGSIKFEYCTIASVEACVTPPNLDTTQATLGQATDDTGGSPGTDMGFTLKSSVADGATNGAPYLTRSAAAIAGSTPITVQLNDVINPNVLDDGSGNPQPNYTFFVRITTYASSDATGTPIDAGSVAASTSTQIQLSGTMPESLIFCTGKTIGVNAGNIPDCTTATGSAITFDKLFSPTDTATAQSQMAASTNATAGYSITVHGTTLTSGSNTITALTTPGVGARGVSQFGMNLVANTTATSTPAAGAAIAPASDNAVDLRAQPATGYDLPDTFKFNPAGDVIANSDYNNDIGPTNAQIYTATYMANVSGSQPAGTYATTLTYICTATF